MAIPKNKDELLDSLITSYNKLSLELETIPESMWRRKTVEGNISVCDVVAYQIGWGKLLLSWYESGKKKDIPVMPREGYKWNELGKLAKRFYAEYQGLNLNELVVVFDDVFKKILFMVRNERESSLYTIGVYNWTGDKWPLGRWINVNSSSPYKSARGKIRKWKRAENLMEVSKRRDKCKFTRGKLR